MKSKTLSLFPAYVVLLSAAYFWILHAVGFTFPHPWPDEASFLWQAIAFQETNSLYAPQLHESRHIMWMPPGYALFIGTVFKLTGFSLETARTVSALAILATMSILLALFIRQRAAFWVFLLCLLALLSGRFVLAGNVARMEALTLLLVVPGTVLVAYRRWYPGWMLLGLSPLIHPNGLHFCLFAGLYTLWFVYRRDKSLLPDPMGLLCALVVVAAWTGYAFYIYANLEGFVQDMQFQVQFKNNVAVMVGDVWHKPHIFVPALVLALSVPILSGHRVRALQLLTASLLSLNLLSFGLQYGVYEALALLIAGILSLLMVLELCEKRRLKSPYKQLAAASVVLVFWGAQVTWGYLQMLPLSADSVAYVYMQAHPGKAWITGEEHRAISDFLDDLDAGADEPIDVYFVPQANAFLFYPGQWENLNFVAYVFEGSRPDVILCHASPIAPRNFARLELYKAVNLAGGVDFTQASVTVLERDAQTRWTATDLRDLQPSGSGEQRGPDPVKVRAGRRMPAVDC